MILVEKIDNEIKELQKVRRIVVKGEKKFNLNEEIEIRGFENLLMEFDIPYQTFTYGNQLFFKIVQPTETELENHQQC